MTAAPVVLALSSALCYGTGDFLGGEGSRRSSPAQMSLLVQGTGLVAAVIAVAITAHGSPPPAVIEWGALAGVGSAIGNQALYRGLATGAMNVVAPLSAVLTAVLPAIVGLAGGDRLGLAGWAGLVIAIPAIGLVSLSPTQPSSEHPTPTEARARSPVRSGVGWGLLAGCGFGLLFVGLDKAGTSSGAWPLLSDQIVAVLLVGAVTTYLRRRARSRTRPSTPWAVAMVWGLASGLGGAGGNICFFAATGAGSLTVVAVLSALYPAVTVLLAAIVLHEKTGSDPTHRTGHLGGRGRAHLEHMTRAARKYQHPNLVRIARPFDRHAAPSLLHQPPEDSRRCDRCFPSVEDLEQQSAHDLDRSVCRPEVRGRRRLPTMSWWLTGMTRRVRSTTPRRSTARAPAAGPSAGAHRRRAPGERRVSGRDLPKRWLGSSPWRRRWRWSERGSWRG